MHEPARSSPSDGSDSIGRRAASRLRLSIPARIMTIYETHNCILLDLSRSGARIGLAEPLVIGGGGYLRIGQLEVFGQAVRRMIGAGGGVNGIAFDTPLSDAAVLAIRHHAETFQRTERDALREQVRRWVKGDN